MIPRINYDSSENSEVVIICPEYDLSFNHHKNPYFHHY